MLENDTSNTKKCPRCGEEYTLGGGYGAHAAVCIPKHRSMDALERMWDQQDRFMRLLQEKRGFPEYPTDISSKKGQKFLKDITHHIMDELFEAAQHLKNAKSHRKTLIPEIDREAYKEELVDAQHLLFELIIASGITMQEFVEAYLKKGETNFERIRGDY